MSISEQLKDLWERHDRNMRARNDIEREMEKFILSIRRGGSTDNVLLDFAITQARWNFPAVLNGLEDLKRRLESSVGQHCLSVYMQDEWHSTVQLPIDAWSENTQQYVQYGQLRDSPLVVSASDNFIRIATSECARCSAVRRDMLSPVNVTLPDILIHAPMETDLLFLSFPHYHPAHQPQNRWREEIRLYIGDGEISRWAFANQEEDLLRRLQEALASDAPPSTRILSEPVPSRPSKSKVEL